MKKDRREEGWLRKVLNKKSAERFFKVYNWALSTTQFVRLTQKEKLNFL